MSSRSPSPVGAPSPTPRGNWGSQAEFVLSCIGYAVGLAIIWRFPYLCMRNGGGAFLIPYFTFLVLCGVPLYFMEVCLGQYSGLSPLSLWKLCPLLKGIGWGMVAVSAVLSIYYITVMAWIMYFLGMSFSRDVPWSSCDNAWNTPNCTVFGAARSAAGNLTGYYNGTSDGVWGNGTSGVVVGAGTSAAEEFWSRKVLGISDGIENLGGIKWELALCLLGTWAFVYICLCKGIKTSGKVVYVSATLPYLLLTIILIRGATLPGSMEGIKFYIVPKWSSLLNFKVWTDACLQVFFSLGPAWGGLITMASYNRFHNNCLRDTLLVCLACGGSSFYAGFAVFAILGYMAHASGTTIDKVATQGPGLAFVAYPEAIARLPFSPFWAVIFFLTLLALGVDGQFGTLETVISGFLDEFPALRRHKHVFGVCVVAVMFLIGLPFVTEGGMYLFQIFDLYSTTFSVMVIAMSECCVVAYVYGIGRFYNDINFMLKGKLSYLWAFCWCGVTPVLLVGMLIVSAVALVPPKYGDYEYPDWAISMGWAFAMVSIVPIPFVAIYRLLCERGNFCQRVSRLLRPRSDWGPQGYALSPAADSDEFYTSWRGRMVFHDDVRHVLYKQGVAAAEVEGDGTRLPLVVCTPQPDREAEKVGWGEEKGVDGELETLAAGMEKAAEV